MTGECLTPEEGRVPDSLSARRSGQREYPLSLEKMIDKLAGDGTALDQETALQIALDPEIGEVGAADKSDGAIDYEELGVHRGAVGSFGGGPVELAGLEAGEGVTQTGEARIVLGALEQQHHLDPASCSVTEGLTNRTPRQGGVADQDDLVACPADQLAQGSQGEPVAACGRFRAGPHGGDHRLVVEHVQPTRQETGKVRTLAVLAHLSGATRRVRRCRQKGLVRKGPHGVGTVPEGAG